MTPATQIRLNDVAAVVLPLVPFTGPSVPPMCPVVAHGSAAAIACHVPGAFTNFQAAAFHIGLATEVLMVLAVLLPVWWILLVLLSRAPRAADSRTT